MLACVQVSALLQISWDKSLRAKSCFSLHTQVAHLQFLTLSEHAQWGCVPAGQLHGKPESPSYAHKAGQVPKL